MKYISYTKKHRAYLCCVNRMEGPQTDLPLYANYLPVKTPEQQSFYKRFLEAVPNQLEEVQSLLRQGKQMMGRTQDLIFQFTQIMILMGILIGIIQLSRC